MVRQSVRQLEPKDAIAGTTSRQHWVGGRRLYEPEPRAQ
jgi:hypothetical protein